MTKKSDNDERTEGIHQALIGLVLIILSAVLIILGVRALKDK